MIRDLEFWEQTCPKCEGDGRWDKHMTFHFTNRCPECNGTGIVTKPECRIKTHKCEGEE